MRVDGKHYRSIWISGKPPVVEVIDQRKLPFDFVVAELRSLDNAFSAIRDMVVRGAPLIGVTAAYGLWLSARESSMEGWKEDILRAGERLCTSRPTAVNLEYAVERGIKIAENALSRNKCIESLLEWAGNYAEEEVQRSLRIGEHGLELIRDLYREKQDTVNILTHCNAGWLACVDYGTATAPVYLAHDEGIPVHVWVDETRPRLQGARLTAFELGEHGVSHTVITDNAGGYLMQHGQVDLVMVGSDRTTRSGDVINKIGTYLKALAAKDNGIPFYVALPSSTIDMNLFRGEETEIEFREEEEVRNITGWDPDERFDREMIIVPRSSGAANPGFDVTPARLVSGLITERGICAASEKGILSLFGDRDQ